MGKWEKVRLGDVCIIERGGSPRPIDNYLTDNEDGVNWIKIGDTEPNSMYITKTKEKIIAEGVKKSRRVYSGDFLLSNSMSFGRPYILKIDGCIHDGWLLIRDEKNIFDKRFLYYYLSSDAIYFKFKGLAVGGVVNNLNSSMVRNVKVPLPPLDVQQNIADVLDKASALIELRKTQKDKLDLIIKSQFIEMFGDPVTNAKGWETVSLNSICDGIGDGLHGTPNYQVDGEFPFINGNNLIDGKIVITPATKSINISEYEKYYIEISNNAILVSINGTLGKLAFYHGEKIVLGKSACYCNLKPNMNKCFIYGLMKSNGFQRFLESSSTKSTIKNVGLKAMREFQVIKPPIFLQNEFAAFVGQVDKNKKLLQQSLSKLELNYKSLMQKCFRGEIF
ncbi:conserved protein of unknown function [Ruminococcaceae bacterium BL-4]|nr:conserved protein of unknown function [Ruminococcaceae bacterium BL-4]